jgi:hypothetical protein
MPGPAHGEYRRRRSALAVLVLLLAACTLATSQPTATPAPATPAPAHSGGPLIVAWAAGGDLFTWHDDTLPRRIASGGVIRPFLSPDGEWVAYLRGPGGDPRTLWVSDSPGANERQLIDAAALPIGDASRRLSEIVWSADSSMLYFNTLTGESINIRPADDLWRVEVRTGTAERLLADGEGGAIALSPDGDHLALASAGEYTQPGEPLRTPGRVAFYTLATRERRVALKFAPVATASERRWTPGLPWIPDSSGLHVAIPPAELVYGGNGLMTALWWLPVAGDAVQTGQVDADFFGPPAFSADGAWIAYLQRRQTPDQDSITLMVAHSDGADTTAYLEGAVGTLTLPEWLPGSARFVLVNGAPGTLWIGGPGGTPVRFPAEGVPVDEIIWAGADTYVFSTSAGQAFTLQWGRLDGATPPQTIATLDAYPFFDAVLPHAR